LLCPNICVLVLLQLKYIME